MVLAASLFAMLGRPPAWLAHAAGLNRRHVQLLESGLSDRAKGTPANPRLSTLVNLCEVLRTDVAKFVADVFQGADGGPDVDYDSPHL